MLDHSFLNTFAGYVERAKTAQIITPPTGSSTFLLRDPATGKTRVVEAPAPPRKLELFTITAMVEFVLREDKAYDAASLKSATDDYSPRNDGLFLSENKLVYLFDREDTRQRAVCHLRHTEQYQWLKTNGGKGLSQTDFVRAMRLKFRDVVNADVVSLLKNLKFNVQSESGAVIDNHKSSISRSVQQQVMTGGEGVLPDNLDVRCKVFQGIDAESAEMTIDCALETDAQQAKIFLTPYPSELEDALQESLQIIKDMIERELPGRKVHLGMPWMDETDDCPDDD